MHATKPQYLRLFDKTGAWINRPDFMVLAALSNSDPVSIEHTYSSMVLAEALNPNASKGQLSAFAEKIKSDVIGKHVRQRVLAGHVVIELARLAAATHRPPSVNAARRLVAFNQYEYFHTSEPANVLRDVEKSFSMFRNTSHLQAAVVFEHNLVFEGDEENCRKLLGLARAFEEFIDANVVSKSFEWSPIRVPVQIERRSLISFPRLSDQEIRASIGT